MRRSLIQSSAFARMLKRWLKRHPGQEDNMRAALELLEADAFHPRLRTHKLKGKWAGDWACSAGYDLRIVFQFISHEGGEAILLEALGSHDEVY